MIVRISCTRASRGTLWPGVEEEGSWRCAASSRAECCVGCSPSTIGAGRGIEVMWMWLTLVLSTRQSSRAATCQHRGEAETQPIQIERKHPSIMSDVGISVPARKVLAPTHAKAYSLNLYRTQLPLLINTIDSSRTALTTKPYMKTTPLSKNKQLIYLAVIWLVCQTY